MDVYSAKVTLNRMIEFVKQSSSSSTKMYGKTKDRFLDIRSTCYELIDEIDKLVGVKFTDATVLPDVQDTEIVDHAVAHTKSQVIANYHVVLKNIAGTRSGYHEVDALAHTLVKWYEARFIKGGEADNFKCNTKYMGHWILITAIGYGNALEAGTGKEYLSSINTFAEDLEQDFSSSKYVLPWDIYKSIKDLSGQSVSLTGAVIWDVLYDIGLHMLDPRCSLSYMPQGSAKTLYDARPDDAPYYYSDYKHSEKVRQRVRLTNYDIEEDS